MAVSQLEDKGRSRLLLCLPSCLSAIDSEYQILRPLTLNPIGNDQYILSMTENASWGPGFRQNQRVVEAAHHLSDRVSWLLVYEKNLP